ncbi:MAG: hypothetical protein J1F35_04280 [Erysipelotrichales bacterium]|nr:hypothetical protein [Erysipelotrichales bacterium]
MNEKKAVFTIDILKNIINVYFDTFFVMYFFKVANYEVLPLAKYYLTFYFFISIGFFIIRNFMKRNVKVPYFRMGISLQALYISLIMLLKEDIINHIFLIGFIKGMADGFYHFPKNILNTEKVTNEDRKTFNGIINIINKIMNIIIPLCMGVALTFISYINLGKVFFSLFVIMFIVSFFLKDEKYCVKSFQFKNFMNLIKKNKKVRHSLAVPFLAGFTYSSGVMGTIITLSKINIFKTNLNLGFVDSLCAFLSLIICTLYTIKVKKERYSSLLHISSVISFFTLILFAFYPKVWVLITYLIVRFSFILTINLISDNVIVNLSNCKELKENFKPEYYFTREVLFTISRCFGYSMLLLMCLFLGKEYINYLMIIPAVSLLLEGIIVARLSKVQE